MTPEDKVERILQDRLRFSAGATLRRRMLARTLDAQRESQETNPASLKGAARRTIMNSRTAKLASVAALVALATLAISLVPRFTRPAYAIEQTVEALQNVRFLHIIERDDRGLIEDERWIEIGADGFQIRYRQQNPPSVIATHPGAPLMVIEDGDSTAVYREDKRTVILYDRENKQYQWVGRLGVAFENLRQEGTILEENDEYQGRPVHKVWWPYLSAECYVDPETKLPITLGDTELSYEEPSPEIFEIVFPEGYAIVDTRPGAAESLPDWLLEESSADAKASEAFEQATHALANGDYATAVESFTIVTEIQLRRNWAWFWQGSAHCGLGQYDLAVEKFTKVLEIFEGDPCYYCNYARALAYAQLRADEAAEEDLRICLPEMVRALRIPSAGKMFEYANNPLISRGKAKPSDQEVVTHMINRLRIVSGRRFGYDPGASVEANEVAISAWEEWLETDGQIDITLDAELLPEIPGTGDTQ